MDHGPGVVGVHDPAVKGVGFHPFDDPLHHRHRFDGILPCRGFLRQHHRVRAVINGGGDIGCFGPGGRGRMDHGIEHLGRHDYRRAGQTASPDDPLLQARHLLGRHLDAEISARHHDGIGKLDDIVETGHRHRFLQLGHDGDSAVDKVADGGDIVGPLDEGQPHPVRPVLEGEFEVPAVLFRQRRDR